MISEHLHGNRLTHLPVITSCTAPERGGGEPNLLFWNVQTGAIVKSYTFKKSYNWFVGFLHLLRPAYLVLIFLLNAISSTKHVDTR